MTTPNPHPHPHDDSSPADVQAAPPPPPVPQAPPRPHAEGTMMLTAQAPPAAQAPNQAPPAQAPPAQAPPAQAHAQGWPPPQAPQAPQAAYAGAPVQGTHLGHALASEWTKIRTVRSTMWTLGAMFLLVVGIGFLVAVAENGTTTRIVSSPLLGGGLFGLMLGQICIITLGVLVITSEYGTGMIRTTMTACPSRSRVLLAKAVVFFLVAFLTTTVAAALTALIRVGMLGDTQVLPQAYVSDGLQSSVVDGRLTATGDEWLSATVGAGLFVALLGLLALAVGAMLRHSAGAITAMLGVVLLPMLVAMFMSGEDLSDVRDALLEYSPLNGLASMFGMPMQSSFDTGGWALLGLLAGVTGAALAGALATVTNRDV